MMTNEGNTDRLIRLVVGFVLLAAAVLSLTGTLKIVAIVLGLVMLVTAAVGFCPLYRIFGISTCKVR